VVGNLICMHMSHYRHTISLFFLIITNSLRIVLKIPARSWGRDLQKKKKNKFGPSFCGWSSLALVTDNNFFCEKSWNYFEYYEILFFRWKLVTYPPFHIWHWLIWLFFNINYEHPNVSENLYTQYNISKMFPKSCIFMK